MNTSAIVERETEKPRNRFLQFRLRTLLILVTLSAFLIAWFALERNEARREKKLADWIVGEGGKVEFRDFRWWRVDDWFGGDVRSVTIRSVDGFDATRLSEFENLSSLEIDDCIISDLGLLPKVETLWIEDTELQESLTDNHFPKLHSLTLSRMSNCDLTGLAPTSQLVDFAAFNSENVRLPQEGLLKLEMVVLEESEISEITFVAHSPQLRSLRITRAPIRDLSPLAGSNLTLLHLDRIATREVSPISEITTLESLSLFGRNFSRLPSFEKLSKLQWLVLYETSIADLASLAEAKTIEELSLSLCPVEKLEPLSSLEKLRTLSISNCPIESITPLKNLKLKHLSLSGTKVSAKELAEFRGAVDFEVAGD